MSSLLGNGALMLWLDVASELERETDRWYIDEHMPERIDIGGYLRARRFVAVEGTPAYLTLFEAETPAALASEGYLRLVGRISAQSQRIRAGFSNVVRETFVVRRSLGRGIGACVASIRLTLRDAAHPEVAAEALDTMVPQLLRHHGVIGVHWLQAAPEIRAQMDSRRVTGHSDGHADYVLLIEGTRIADIQAACRDARSAAVLERSGWGEQAFAVYSLLYEVSVQSNGRGQRDRV